MLSKLETKSNRVKGLSFHPTRPWILASLHNGVIQLWDYRIRTLIEKFDEHEGPVRGVCFHLTQPLFVSGGDDYKIKVWNYKQRRCLFTLLGHLDYIRTVEFHHEYPWILSASDDQTIRIWNWQSRGYIAVLTGHNHYVMCARFHPKEDLVVSASLDQTIRVWDISGLRKKNVSPGAHGFSHEDSLRIPQNDLFGSSDVVVKYVVEGHDRGVNWASFHPSSPLIVSGADDRLVKLWRMDDSKAWEVDSFRGHFNNVSCAIFHPQQEMILSNSEDKTIRLWDITKRGLLQTFRREHDRFWILAAHPHMNLFAAGHDSGMIVFKLERERPPFTTFQNEMLLYVKDKYIRRFEFASARDVPILSLRKSGASSKIKSVSFNAQDLAVLLQSEADGGHYELYLLPRDQRNSDAIDSKRGLGIASVFVGRKRFAVLDKSQQIIIKNMENEEIKRCEPPYSINNIFGAPLGNLLLHSEDKVALYDVAQKKVISELNTPEIKYVYWSFDQSMVALVSKETIIIANKKLEQLCVVHEQTIRIKGGAWDDHGIFLYSTLNHIKYCIPNGDSGIVRTLDSPVYITAVRGNRVLCLDRECKQRTIAVDNTEYIFKYLLWQKKYSQVLKMVREFNLIGQSIIAYLQKKGYPEVALYFVKDEKTKFDLALECGNIEIALECAKILDDKECWNRLGTEGLRQGNHQIVEMAYQRTKNFERLSFLYLITGNIDKLRKMLKISEMRGDTMSRFHNALYLGDVAERIKILEEVGQHTLAYTMASTFGLQEEAENLKTKFSSEPFQPKPDAKLLKPPTPIMRLHESNWPLLTVHKSFLPGSLESLEETKLGVETEDVEDIGGEWVQEDIRLPGEETEELDLGEEETQEPESVEENQWELDELDLGPEIEQTPSKSEKVYQVLPHSGLSSAQIWCNNSNLAADHAAAGSFQTAMKLLNQQCGIVQFEPLKPLFMALYMGSNTCLSTVASIPPLSSSLQRNAATAGLRGGLPLLSFGLQNLIENRLKAAYRATTAGKFSEALKEFTTIMHSILFIVVDSKREAYEAKELLSICREYALGLRIEFQRKELQAKQADPVRQAELAAYFTHCNLQTIHLMLSLRSAMTCAYKIKNYQTAASFARRLLELEPKAEVASQAKKVIKFSEQHNENQHNLNYDERNPFVICGISFTPIYKGSPLVKCPFCGTSFKEEYTGKVCPTCEVAEIGKETIGIQLFQGSK